MIDVPHIALPFRYVNGKLVVTQQNSLDEIRDCVEVVLRTPLGTRPELPEFGRPDQALKENGASVPELQVAVDEWEPRADVLFQAEPDALDKLISRVQVEVGTDD